MNNSKNNEIIQLRNFLNEQTYNNESLNISPQTTWEMLTSDWLITLIRTFTKWGSSKFKFVDSSLNVGYFISSYLRKSNLWQKISCDCSSQEIFVLGYIHALNEYKKAYTEIVDTQISPMIRQAVASYKYIVPIVYCLEEEFQLSHNKLAKKINITPQALSNFMSRIEKYNIVFSNNIGKNRYYTLNKPNSDQVLALANKKDNTIESNTNLLSVLLDYFIAVSKNESTSSSKYNDCIEQIMKEIPLPCNMINKMNYLTAMLQFPRYSLQKLLELEVHVKFQVQIYSVAMDKEVCAFEEVFSNIVEKKISYKYYYPKQNFSHIKQVILKGMKDYLKIKNISDQVEEYNNKIQFFYMDEERINTAVGNNLSEIVIYDSADVYFCEDRTINCNTLYYPPPELLKRATIATFSNI